MNVLQAKDRDRWYMLNEYNFRRSNSSDENEDVGNKVLVDENVRNQKNEQPKSYFGRINMHISSKLELFFRNLKNFVYIENHQMLIRNLYFLISQDLNRILN